MRLRQEDPELEASLGYIISSRQAYDIYWYLAARHNNNKNQKP